MTTVGYSSKEEAAFALGGSHGVDEAEFKEVSLTPKEILAGAMTGHTLCHLFHHTGDTFVTDGVKNRENYKGTQCLFIDFDGASCSMHEYIDKLTTKPTIAYNTFGHMVYDNKKGIVPIKFRLIYCLNELITTERMYHGYHDGIKALLLREAGDIVGWDVHNRSVAQCIFGSTTDGDREQYLNANAIYSKDSLPFIDPGEDNCNISNPKNCTPARITTSLMINKDMVKDFYNVKLTEFCKKYAQLIPVRKYKTEELDYDDFLHCYILPSNRRYAEYMGYFDFKNKKAAKLEHGRGTYILNAATRFHSIYGESLTCEQLLLLLAEYCLRYIKISTWHPQGYNNWKDRLINITVSTIKNNMYHCESTHKNKNNDFYFVVDKVWCRQNGVDPQAYSKAIPMKREMLRVLRYWDFSKPDTVNYVILSKKGIKKGKNTMSRWRKEHSDVLAEVLEYIERNSLRERDGFEQYEHLMEERAKTLGLQTNTEKEHESIRKIVSSHVKKISTMLTKQFNHGGGANSKCLYPNSWKAISPTSRLQGSIRDLLMGIPLFNLNDRPTDFHYYQKFLFEKMEADHPRLFEFVTEVMLPERCKFNEREQENGDSYTFVFPIRVLCRADAFVEAFRKYMSFIRFTMTSNIVYKPEDYRADVILHSDVCPNQTEKAYIYEAIFFSCYKARILLTTGTRYQVKVSK